jgi:enoyl-CoA hydratase/carnithine racemase
MPLIIRTRPHPTVHLLTLSSPPDNRLTPELLHELATQLDDIEADWRRAGGGEMDPAKRNAHEHKGAGAVVLTSACKGFFSNGLDYKNSVKNPRFFPGTSIIDASLGSKGDKRKRVMERLMR